MTIRPPSSLACPSWCSALLVAGLFAAGCGYNPTGEPWSTKNQSTPGASLASSRLNVEPDPETEVQPDPNDVGVAAVAPVTEEETPTETAVRILLEASEMPGPAGALLRANAIQGVQYAPEHLPTLVAMGLADENRGVRFVAAMSVGEFQLDELAHLLEPMLDDESASVRAAAMYGLKRCGRSVDLSPLATMIMSDDPEVRGNAALIIGELGNPSAIPMVRHAVGRGMEFVQSPRVKMVDLQLAEALVKLGEEREIEAIRAALFSPAEEGEITALACMICGRLDDGKAVANLVRLALEEGRFRQPAEVRMAATWALAHIAPEQAEINVPLAYVTSPYYQLRVQAALTLGELGNAAAVPTLVTLMGDENPLVQVGAATAILQIENPRARSRDQL